jgi:hypothetical protein
VSIDPLWEEYCDLTPYQYSANNPLMYKDPTGKFIGTLSGAAIGALVGAIDAYARGKDPLKGAIEGGVSGAIAGAAVDITLATGGAGCVLVAGAAVGGGVGSFAGDVAGQIYDNYRHKEKDVSKAVSNVDLGKAAKQIPMGVVSGAVSGVVGVTSGRLLKSAVGTTDDVLLSASKQLESTAKTLMKMGASQATINNVSSKMVNGMYQAATNTAKNVVTVEIFVTVVTDATVNTATKTVSNPSLNISNK